MLEGLQNLRPALQQDLFVAAVHVGEDFRVASSSRRSHAHLDRQLKSGRADDLLQKIAQGIRRSLSIQFAVLNKFLSHSLTQSRWVKRTTDPFSIALLFLVLVFLALCLARCARAQ